MVVTQHGIKLAVHLISTYFGDLRAKVCECLLRKGTLTYANIIRFTGLNKETVRNSLLLLIQHNCVQAFAVQQEGGFGDAPKVITQYMVLFDNIIHHIRFPKFLQMVTEEHGEECAEILLGLLQHGRLTLNQMLDRYKATSKQSGGNIEAQDALQKNFNKLVHARYVERCPAHEPFVDSLSEEESAAKKRGAKASKLMAEAMTLEQRALAAAAPMDSLRFLIETFDESDDNEQDNKGTVSAGKKRKMELDPESESKQKKEVLWRANVEEFVRCMKRKACVENVRKRFDDGAAVVLNAVLQATATSETRVKIENSVPLSVENIFEEVIKSEKGRVMTLEHVRAALVQLGCHLPAIDIDETYSIDLKSIIELAQNEEVESIVLKKYGRDAYRIFRLLLKAGHFIETDKISDTTFVEKREITKILYKLWKDDFLHMEKLEAKGNAKQSNFLLWKVNKQHLWEHVLDDMYHAALNLNIRVAYEIKQENEVLQLPRDKLFGDLAQRYKRVKKVRAVLESSLMHLDDAILLFNDF